MQPRLEESLEVELETLSRAAFSHRTFNRDLDMGLPPRLPNANGSQRRFGVKLFKGRSVRSGDEGCLRFGEIRAIPKKRPRGQAVAVTENHVYAYEQRSSGPVEHRAQRQAASRS